MKQLFYLLIVAIFIIGCGQTATPVEELKEIETSIPTQEPTLTPTKKPEKDYGFTMTVTKVIDPAEPGMFYEKKDGYKLIAVEVIVENKSLDSLSVNTLYFSLVDNEGFVYDNELMGIDDEMPLTELSQGEKVKGLVSFTIPNSAKPAKIKFTVDWISENTLVVNIP